MKTPNDIKNQLVRWIKSDCYYNYSEHDVLIEELCFVERKARADLVYANGKMTAFEIKSPADNLSRWRLQHDAYLRVFDSVWLCCHYKHAMKAIGMSSDVVGIIVVDDSDSGMAVLRQAKCNKNYSRYDVISLLWRSELDDLCRDNDIRVISKERISEARERVLTELHFDIIKNKVLESIKLRYREKSY
ncbi:sce7726 family protein [Serratia marcescens]|uniref:sce7726 family protein n=1 Tax=Serratia marcescens TaxID=615 RepID=UPI001EF07E31|nr:sce7726 family protein [Serratia marcescens]ULH09602.1 sce7726 family protein [Serratia marcescens]